MNPESPTSGSQPSSGWSPPAPEELQKILPKYEITSLLGSGGMGAVYKGRQTSLDRPVAIKILSNALKDVDPSFAERFKVEARAMGQLNHPGIIAVHDFGETDHGLLYIVMEYVGGTDVARMIAQQGRLLPDHAIAITAHVCDAMAYAHSKGILHRDIKPANVMVGYDGVVKIADFGLAKMNADASAADLTHSGMAMGTMHYMAPECFSGATAADHRADIYALGVMFYQMLTGKLPCGVFDWPSQQINGLDARYDEVIAKAIRESREERYQSAGHLRLDLDQVLSKPVVKVAPGKDGPAPAALPTMARPQRSSSSKSRVKPLRGQPAAARPAKKNAKLLPALVGTGALVALAFVFFKPAPPSANKVNSAPLAQAASHSATSQSAPAALPKDNWPTGPHFRSAGRFRTWSSIPDDPAIDLTSLASLTDISELRIHEKGWVLLRKDGAVMANALGANGTKDIKRICPGLGGSFALITSTGRLTMHGVKADDTTRTPPASLGPVKDAYISPPFHVALQEDGKLVVWGRAFDGKTEKGNPEWKVKPSLPAGNKAVAMAASDATLVVKLEDGSFLAWHGTHGALKLPEELTRIQSTVFGTNRNHIYISPADGSPTLVWATDGKSNVRHFDGREHAIALQHSNRDLFGIDSNSKPFVTTGFEETIPVVKPVLAAIPKASAGKIAAYVSLTPPIVAKLIWFDDTPSAASTPIVQNGSIWPPDGPHFRRIGNFKFWHSEPNPPLFGKLPMLKKIADVAQVYHGDGAWVVLRSNGQTLSNNPTKCLENIARICHGQASFTGFIDQAGRFTAVVPDPDQFPDRKAPENLLAKDAALSPSSNVILTPDGKLALYGKAFDGVNSPPNNGEWAVHPAIPKGRSVMAITHEESMLGCLMENRTVMLWKVNLGALALPSALVSQKFLQIETTSERLFGILESNQPVSWKLNDQTLATVPGLTRATSLHDAGREALFFLDAEGRPHFPKPDGPLNTTVVEPVLPYIQGAKPDLISFRLTSDDKLHKTAAWMIWYDGPGTKLASTATALSAPTPAPVANTTPFDLPDFNTRLDNYRTARHAQLSALETRYRDAIAAERTKAMSAGGLPMIEYHNSAIAGAAMLASAIATIKQAPAPRPLPTVGVLSPSAPRRLHELRDILVKEIIRTDYTLVAALDQSLATVQTSLLKKGDQDLAKRLEAYRREMMAAFPRPEETPINAAPLSPTPAPSGPTLSAPAVASPSASAATPATATKDKPFINTIGMKFVPVPGTKVLFCIHETRLGDFKPYAATVPGIHQHWKKASLNHQPVSREDNYPVVAVTRMDAEGFCKWLTEESGMPHRLPTDEEWSRAVGIGHKERRRSDTTPRDLSREPLPDYSWGSSFPPRSDPPPENLKDASYTEAVPSEPGIPGYNDGFAMTAPVMSLQPNNLGIYDLGGNVAEWVSDWYDGKHTHGVFRGARYTTYNPDRATASQRQAVEPGDLRFSADRGFRVVIELP